MMSVIFGTALGFLHPSQMIKSGASTGADIKMFFLMLMIETVAIFLLTLSYQETPPSAPSISSNIREDIAFRDGLWMLLKNKNYILLSMTYGIMYGLGLVITLLLNPSKAPQMIIHVSIDTYHSFTD